MSQQRSKHRNEVNPERTCTHGVPLTQECNEPFTGPTEFYFTFGGNHRNREGYVTIAAPRVQDARTVMFQKHGDQWAFCYNAVPSPEVFTRGELARYQFVTATQSGILVRSSLGYGETTLRSVSVPGNHSECGPDCAITGDRCDGAQAEPAPAVLDRSGNVVPHPHAGMFDADCPACCAAATEGGK